MNYPKRYSKYTIQKYYNSYIPKYPFVYLWFLTLQIVFFVHNTTHLFVGGAKLFPASQTIKYTNASIALSRSIG